MKISVDVFIKDRDGVMVHHLPDDRTAVRHMMRFENNNQSITFFMSREVLTEIKQEIETCLIESSDEAAGAGE